MEHCSIGQVHALQSQCRVNRWIVLVGYSLVRLVTLRYWCYWCEAIPAFVYPMLSCGQHAGWDQMKLIGEPNYHLTWGHSFSTLHSLLSQKSSPILQTFLNSLSVELVASVWSPNCSPVFLYHDIFGWCVMPTAFRMFVSLDFVPTLPLKESFEESGIRVGWPAGPLRNPALFSN